MIIEVVSVVELNTCFVIQRRPLSDSIHKTVKYCVSNSTSEYSNITIFSHGPHNRGQVPENIRTTRNTILWHLSFMPGLLPFPLGPTCLRSHTQSHCRSCSLRQPRGSPLLLGTVQWGSLAHFWSAQSL